MLERLRGNIDRSFHLYRTYFDTMRSMENLWEFYCAPETQKGLIDRSNTQGKDANAVVVQGSFSWGITPKLDKADKDKIKEKLRKKEYDEKTKNMGAIRKWCYDLVQKKDVHAKVHIPYNDRTLNQITNLQDLDIKIKKGSFTVIIGEMGSGKTSLLNCMIGEMISVSKDEISLIGEKDRPIKDMELRGLEDALLKKDFTGDSPIKFNGSTGFYEQ